MVNNHAASLPFQIVLLHLAVIRRYTEPLRNILPCFHLAVKHRLINAIIIMLMDSHNMNNENTCMRGIHKMGA